MNSTDELMASTLKTIDCYAKLVDLHLRAVAEGANPNLDGSMKDMMSMVYKNLPKEVELLSFLRESAIERSM